MTALEELLVLLDIQIICARQISPACELERQFGVVECCQDIRDHRVVVDADAEDLSLPVDTEDSIAGVVFASHEDSLAGDTVHVDAGTGLEVIEMDETVLRREVNDAVSLGDLHGDGEIIGRLGREVNVDGFLRERRVGRLVVNLHNVKLPSGNIRRNCKNPAPETYVEENAP